MHYYLVPYVGKGTSDDPYRPRGAPLDGEPWAGLDLRPDATSITGNGLLALPDRVQALAGFHLGDEPYTRSEAVRQNISSRLGLSLRERSLAGIAGELMVEHAREDGTRWRPVQADASGIFRVHLGELVWQMRAVQGGADYAETFDKADSTILGPDLVWTETAGTHLQVVSNRIRAGTAGTLGRARAAPSGANLMGANHYVELTNVALQTPTVNDNRISVCARYSTSAETYYIYRRRVDSAGTAFNDLQKSVAGAVTALGTGTATAMVSGEGIRLVANGSQISGILYDPGVPLISPEVKITVTDTAIASGPNGGVELLYRDSAFNVQGDDYVIQSVSGTYPFYAVEPEGVVSSAAVGTPSVTGGTITLTPSGVESSAGVGTPTVIGGTESTIADVFPTIGTFIGFVADPFDPLDTVVWTDISAYVQSVKTKAGRQHELGRYEAATAAILLDNTDRRFDPAHTSGPYYPDVVPMRRVRVAAYLGTALDFNGASQYATSGSAGPNPGSTSLTLEAWMCMDSFSSAQQTIVGQLDGAGTGRSLLHVTNTQKLGTQLGGTAVQSTRTLHVGVWYHVAVVYERVAPFTVTLLVDGVEVYSAAVTGESATGALRLAANKSAVLFFNGRIDEMRVWNTARSVAQLRTYARKKLAGTETGLVAYWQLDDATGTTAQDATASNNDLTLTAAPTWVTGKSVRPQHLFTGYVEGWEPTYEDPEEAFTTLRCVDAFRALALLKPTRSPYSQTILNDSPYLYWRLGETVGSVAADASGNGRDGTYTDGVGRSEGLLVNDPDGGVVIGPNAYVDGGLVASFGINDPFSVECLVRFDENGNTGGSLLISKYDVPNDKGWNIRLYGDDAVEVNLRNSSGNRIQVHARLPVTDGVHHIIVTYDGSRTAAGVFIFVDGVLRSKTILNDTLSLAITHTEPFRVGLAITSNIDEVAVYDSVLTAAQAAAHAAAAFAPWEGHRFRERGNALLNTCRWPADDRLVDQGVTTLTMTEPLGAILDELQTLAETELGAVYVAPDGRIIIAGRYANIIGSTSSITYGDAGTEADMLDLGIAPFDDTDLLSVISATRPGGRAQIVEDATATARYGSRTLDREGLWSDDNQALAVADKLLDRYATPKQRFTGLKVKPITEADFATLLGMVMHLDRVTVNRRPPGGGAVISRSCWVAGIEHHIRDVTWESSIQFVPADTAVTDGSYITVGKSTFGGAAVFAY